jgi:hypothetical protein
LLLISLSSALWFSNFPLNPLISILHLTCQSPCCDFSFCKFLSVAWMIQIC